MFGSIHVGMSGLQTHSQGLKTISHNVSNLNTLGFKASTPRFDDLYRGYPSPPGAAMPHHGRGYGGGVEYAYAHTSYAQGDLQASDGTLDLALQGDGFLTVLDGEQARYVRTGQFVVNDQGALEERSTGLSLAALAPDGTLHPISLAGRTVDPPQATSRIAFSGNLSSGATEFSIPSLEVYDGTGAQHTLTAKFTPDDAMFPGRWAVTLEDDAGVRGTATLQFLGGIPEPGMDVLELELDLPGGTQIVQLDFSSEVTSFSAGTYSSLTGNVVDGRAAGEFSALRIDEQGRIEMSYSNGNTATLETVALASFADLQQLEQVGEGLFEAAEPSAVRYASSAQDGLGQLQSGAVEASNVDLSGEFGRLILMQRGFQASSQVISTANEMIQQLFQMRGQG